MADEQTIRDLVIKTIKRKEEQNRPRFVPASSSKDRRIACLEAENKRLRELAYTVAKFIGSRRQNASDLADHYEREMRKQLPKALGGE